MPGRADRVRIPAVLAGVVLLAAGVVLARVDTTRADGVAVASATPAPVRSTEPGPTPTPSATPTTLRTLPAWPGATQPARPGTPVRLVVPALRVDTRPHPIGRLTDGRLDVPKDAAAVAWWAYGAAPGERRGTVVVAGHVSWWGRWGTFARLGTLSRGDRVRLVRADGEVVPYAVTAVVRTPKTRLDRLGVFATDGPPGLALVTCGGRWDPVRRSYDENVVVRATPAA
ncbi:MAG: sortase [Streptosporangiales bacterium]|nr:sortase [Streptosporangiales bacterium]